jgi:hypothetical protein
MEAPSIRASGVDHEIVYDDDRVGHAGPDRLPAHRHGTTLFIAWPVTAAEDPSSTPLKSAPWHASNAGSPMTVDAVRPQQKHLSCDE